MKVTLPNGTSVEGTEEELSRLGYLPPAPKFNWDGSPAVTCRAGEGPHWIPPLAGFAAATHGDPVHG